MTALRRNTNDREREGRILAHVKFSIRKSKRTRSRAKRTSRILHDPAAVCRETWSWILCIFNLRRTIIIYSDAKGTDRYVTWRCFDVEKIPYPSSILVSSHHCIIFMVVMVAARSFETGPGLCMDFSSMSCRLSAILLGSSCASFTVSACGTTLLARFWHENSLTYVYLVIYSYVVVSYPYTGGTCTCLSTCWREASLGFTIFFAVPKTARQWPIDLVQR